jgi:glycosyltransferase involved in cell wall biosynthesis
VFPSLYEGFGLPVLEAMACGVPVACSRSSSLPEVAGESAFYFDPAETEDIALALRQLLTDSQLRSRLSAEGLARASTFSWTQTAQRTLGLYRDLLSGVAAS